MDEDNYYEFPFYSTVVKDKEKKVYDEVCNLPLSKLISEFDKTQDGELITNDVRYYVIRGVIADRLGLVPREILGRSFVFEIDSLEKELKSLQSQFKNHRHDSSKTFTGKPEW